MIARKLKQCKTCLQQVYLFSHGNCKDCNQRIKAKEVILKPVKPRKPISKQSDKRKKLDALYATVAVQFKKDNDYCQARLEGCLVYTAHVHHKYSGASRLKYYLDTTTWCAVCSSCHDKIHNSMSMEQLITLDLKRIE